MGLFEKDFNALSEKSGSVQESAADLDALERVVDKLGIDQVVNTLALVCFQKADDVRRGDSEVDAAARKWNSMGDTIGKAAEAVMRLMH